MSSKWNWEKVNFNFFRRESIHTISTSLSEWWVELIFICWVLWVKLLINNLVFTFKRLSKSKSYCVCYLTCTKFIIKPHSHLGIFLGKALLQVLRKCLQIVSHVNFCSHVRIFLYVRAYVELWLQIKPTSRHKIVIFKMASINKHHLLAVALVNLKKRRRLENRKNEKKKIWMKKMSKNRLELGAFSTTFLLARDFNRASFSE